MKKMFMILAFLVAITGYVDMAAAAPAASDVVCNDKLISTNKVVSFTLSKRYTSRPIWLNVDAAYPDNGTVTVRWLHQRADGTVQTNTAGAISLTSGSVSTNLASLFTQYCYPGEPVSVIFSTATNGALQVVGELYGSRK